jgi:ABC-type dipeptide/oligopeptide/nickel transport system permease component
MARRLVMSVGALFGIVVVVFVVVRILPGDGAVLRAGPYASPIRIAQIRKEFGLDQPLLTQFQTYIANVIHGDFGTSIRTQASVTTELMARLAASLEMAFASVLLAALVGIPFGIWAAARRGRWIDHVVRVFAVVGSSMALFWLGLLMIYLFFYRLGWAPGPIGRLNSGTKPPDSITGMYAVDAIWRGQWSTLTDALRHLALPVITLGLVLSAPIIKMVRSAMIESLDSDHVRTARSVGVSGNEILWRDGFRNALIPVTTTMGIVFGYMLGGNIIIEFLFNWPGIGRYAFTAAQNNDIDALQGFVIVVGILYIALNILIDLIYVWVDPRIRIGKAPNS